MRGGDSVLPKISIQYMTGAAVMEIIFHSPLILVYFLVVAFIIFIARKLGRV